jgi:site-specific recombinase XerD
VFDQFFYSSAKIAHLRGNPGAALLDVFAQHLSQSGYSRSQGGRHLRAAAHLLHWLDRQKVSFSEIDSTIVSRFELHLRRCRCTGHSGMPRDRLIRGVRAFITHLQGQALCTTAGDRANTTSSILWEPFCQWMRDQRGISERTLRDYHDYLTDFLTDIDGDLHKLNAAYLRSFILEFGRTCGHARTKAATSALRMFVRFLVAQGQCHSDLVESIPSHAHWRLSTLPQYILPDEVERVIDSPDLQTPVGKRDRAILLLLARLGLRADDVLHLRLEDIDWRAATISLCGKNKQHTQLPLTQEVGQAIVDYLQHGRPSTDSDCIFVRALAPFRVFRDVRGVCDVAKLALRRSGVNAPTRGAAHVLRHSAATSMLRNGVSLQDISTVLRHQSVASTQIYAKVDVPALYDVAQPWPQVLPC